MAKYCGNCGRELSDNAKFCPNCGNSITGEVSATEQKQSTSVREEALNELNKLQKLIDKRFDSDWWEKEYGGDYFVDDYIKEHFNCLDISETVEMSW